MNNNLSFKMKETKLEKSYKKEFATLCGMLWLLLNIYVFVCRLIFYEWQSSLVVQLKTFYKMDFNNPGIYVDITSFVALFIGIFVHGILLYGIQKKKPEFLMPWLCFGVSTNTIVS